MVQIVIQLLAVLTLLSNIFLVIVLGLYLGSKIDKSVSKYWKKLVTFIYKKEIKLALVVSLAATAGSLFLSEVAHFEPCKLCWLQRIFMYPLPIIFGVSIYKKLKETWNIILPLAAIGTIIASYHYYFQVSGNALIPCSTIGFSVSCSERFFTYYGYITIPWMALSAFLMITILSLISLKAKN